MLFRSVYVIKNMLSVFSNVLKIESVTEPKKLLIHGSVVGSLVEPQLNQ